MKHFTLIIICLLSLSKVNGQGYSCNGDPKVGLKVLLPGETDKVITYQIKHDFKLQTTVGFTPLIYSVSFNHAWTEEPFSPCLCFKVNPEKQESCFDPYAMDTIKSDCAYNNNQCKIDSLVALLSNNGSQRTDSAFANSCNSRAKGSTCIATDSVKSDYVTGCIQSFGFSQSINPTSNTDSYAFSWSGITVEDGAPIKTGDVRWQPQLKSTVKGKSRTIRQKAGTNDPVMFRAKNLLTGDDTSATLLSVVMRFQTEDDTLDYENYWENDTVHLESDSILFKVTFPSVYTAQQGFIYLLVYNGFVIQSIKTGVFASVQLPFPGTPVPLSFPMVSRIDFHYNMDTLGMFGGNPMWGQIFMYGNSERNFVRTYDSTHLIPHIRKPSCPGSADGKIELVVNYGTSPYMFIWSNGATTQNISGLTAGIYTVIVMDLLGVPSTCMAVISSPTPVIPACVINNVACKGAHNGSIIASAVGGTPPYTYLWNGGSTLAMRSGLYPKTYTVTITDSKGCSVVTSLVVLQSPTLLTVSTNKTNVKCGGKCNGTATTTPSGGTPPYLYYWSIGATTNTISSLCAGTYTCTVVDAFGCAKTKSVTITQNPPLAAIVSSGGGSATATVSGGIPSYTYNWNTVPMQTNSTATGLIGGHVYKVKVTDSKGCTVVITFTMSFTKILNTSSENTLIYPNPVRNELFVQLLCSENETLLLMISDALGNIVYKRTIQETGLNQTETLNTSGLSNGIYILKIISNKHTETMKFVVNKQE